MDEILIEDKKYISSKQAAKVTGYAKDYIGQLCREGRVPARLVGRSWYVLESAVHDHRFGNPKEEPVSAPESAFTRQSTWESPRYEASETTMLPSINQLHESGKSLEPVNDGDSDAEVAERLQETWQAWFDRFATVATEAASEAPPVVEEEKEEEELEIEVPIRAIHHQPYHPVPRELLSAPTIEVNDAEYIQLSRDEGQHVPKKKEVRRGLTMTLQVAGFVVAVISVSLAALGSGYLDEYIVSNNQVGLIAGVGFYNK